MFDYSATIIPKVTTKTIYSTCLLKKYYNPHHHGLKGCSTTVKRSDLQEIFDSHQNPLDEHKLSKAEALDKLEDIMAPLRTDFIDATRKRKHASRSPSPAQPKHPRIELRLLSRHPVVVSDSQLMPSWQSRKKNLPLEDSEKEAADRRHRAALVAIDFSSIIKQSSVNYPEHRQKKLSEYRFNSKTCVGSIAVLESQKPDQHIQPNQLDGLPNLTSRIPAPKRSLVVSAYSSNQTPRRLRAKAGTSSFYFSHDTVGGKSPGYAWGYASSFPRAKGSSGYLRDNIRIGIDSDTYVHKSSSTTHQVINQGRGRRGGRR